MQADIVILGGGLAALRAAVTAAKSGLEVLLLVKDRLCTGSSFYPMMDIVACQSTDGTPEGDEAFLKEILDTSLGMGSLEMNRMYVRNIREAVRGMEELGIHPRLTDPKPACFARTARPTYCWSGWDEIRARARRLIAAEPRVRVLEGAFALDLIVRDGAVRGVTFMGRDGLETVAAKSVILATGGFGDLYEHSLNTPDVSGDGQVLALNAGAKLINLEFLQFIPGFLSPAYKTVFRESALPYARPMMGADGRDLLERYLPDEEDRRTCLAMRATHGPFTSRGPSKWFDIAMMEEILRGGAADGFHIQYEPSILDVRFTFVTEYVRWLKAQRGVDIVRDEIRIAPFYHAANGGVKIGEDCQTSVRGLFACGEVSGGIHGADRQGGNSTGSCLVFGRIAAERAAEHALGVTLEPITPAMTEESLRVHYGTGEGGRLTPEALLPQIRRLMWRSANVVREEKALKAALDDLRSYAEDYHALPGAMEPGTSRDAAKAAHFLLLGQALLTAMLERRESRGSHYRRDYPNMECAWTRRLEVSLDGGALRCRFEEGGEDG